LSHPTILRRLLISSTDLLHVQWYSHVGVMYSLKGL